MTSHKYILIDQTIATNQLLRLRKQLKDHNGTMYSKGRLQGLIEAYIAILMQPTIILPNKEFL